MAEYINREKAKSMLHIEYAYAAEQLLDEIPSDDVAPVVHGRWIYKKGGFWEIATCSMCGEKYPCVGMEPNYCPNCGAIMDGGDNNADD